MSILNKMERQNQIISFIQQGHKINASDLAKQFNVSTRTITRDIDDLESKGVHIYAHKGRRGGYEIQNTDYYFQLKLNESELIALFLTLQESQSHSTLPYTQDIRSIMNQCLKTPNTQMLKILKHISNNIKLEDTRSLTLPHLFSDILIYSNERHVMLVDFSENNEITAENVIFIGLLCRNGQWFAIVYEIGFGRTRELSILNIVDISYSFEKKIQTYDITIHNYKEFLQTKNNE